MAAAPMPCPEADPVLPGGHGPFERLGKAALRVLLVDDDELIRIASGILLELLGHSVSAAASGEEALALVEAGLRPEAIILDMNMPGMGGRCALPLLRRACPEAPILIATGHTDPEVLALAAAHRGVALLVKPFGIEALQARLLSLAGAGTVAPSKHGLDIW